MSNLKIALFFSILVFNQCHGMVQEKTPSLVERMLRQWQNASKTNKIIGLSAGICVAGGLALYIKNRYSNNNSPQQTSSHADETRDLPSINLQSHTRNGIEYATYDKDRDMNDLAPLLEKEWPLLYNAQFPGLHNQAVASRFSDQRVSGRPVYITVARYTNEIAGFITYYKQNANQGHIDLLAVSEKFRKKGIATELLARAEEHFKQDPKISKFDILVLYTNTSAQSLYEKLGYQLQSDAKSTWLQLLKPLH